MKGKRFRLSQILGTTNNPALQYLKKEENYKNFYLAVTKANNPVLVNNGYLFAAIGLGVFGAYSFVAGWNLEVDERDALVAATKQVGFPVGHASAQMGWRGMLSRPTWRILLYSAEEPPEKRGLVLIDGVDGAVVEWFVEDNPEDWSALT